VNHQATQTHVGYRATVPLPRLPDEPINNPPPTGADRCTHAFNPLGVQCTLAVHPPTHACYAGGVIDGVRFSTWWWPVTVNPAQERA
jgi:hypothetical protein